MSGAILDRRVQKTHQLLKDALVALISEKGFESVTIKEILDRANVGRSTFYMHFSNKNELLHSCFEELRNLFEKHDASLAAGNNYPGSLYETDFTLNLFRFVERNHRLFKALLGKDGMTMFNSPLHDYVFTSTAEALKRLAPNKKQPPLQMEMLAHYMASAFLGTLKWWVVKDMPLTVEELDRYFKQLAMSDISTVLFSNS